MHGEKKFETNIFSLKMYTETVEHRTVASKIVLLYFQFP